ncbi:MAG: hypothetical protein IID30_04810 [Planctomycetes bacterium]|nr:hypothetical protein [Planctomycetota bacterium]
MTKRSLGILNRSSLTLMAVLSCIAFLSTNGCEHDPPSEQTQPDVTSQAADHEHQHSIADSNIAKSDEPIPNQADAVTPPPEVATPPDMAFAELQDFGISTDANCVCQEARVHNGWCDSCGRGFVAGLTIESEKLFEALDAHGHIIDLNLVTCDSCLQAIRRDGFCPVHRWRFADGKMYVSEMTWSLARGTIDEPDQLTCSQCRANCEHRGWCERCGVGHVGAVRFASREDYDRAAQQQDRLGLALVTLKRCEECSMRTFYGGICGTCGTDSNTLPGYSDPEETTMTKN